MKTNEEIYNFFFSKEDIFRLLSRNISFLGFQLYVMLIEVFEVERSRIRWYYLIAYLLPLIIVGVSAAIFPYGYGTERYCWLKQDNNFIYSFVGPVIVVIVVSKYNYIIHL